MRELVRASEIAAFSPEKKLIYDTEIMTELDQLNYEMEQKRLNLAEGYKTGFTEGHETGFTEGVSEGANNKALEMARKMKEENIPLDLIAKCSGLDETAIMRL